MNGSETPRPSAITLSLDAHGGDHGPAVTIAAARAALDLEPGLSMLVSGLAADLEHHLDKHAHDRMRLVPASEVLAGNAHPVTVLRTGSDSSLGRAVQLVADGDADACVSAASTVALMTLAVKKLGMLRGIRRPALMSQIPARNGFTSLLDLGANLNVDALQLVQFAIMGAVVRSEASGGTPSVGLLNVGHEETKGHAVVREAHEMLQGLPLDYRGFIEGNDIFAGKVDVAVCDGFSGNLILKSSEGLARMLFAELGNGLRSSVRARLGARLARPALRGMLERFDPAKHNGAPLLGLRRVVVKSHGHADQAATLQAILEAVHEAQRHVPERIETLIHNCEAEAET